MVTIDGKEWWTRREVAEYLGVKPNSVPALIRDSGLPAAEHRIERSPLWRPEAVTEWHAKRRGQGWRAGQAES